MNIRTSISWVLIILAFGFTFFVFIKPVLNPQIEEVAEGELVYLGRDTETGESWYFIMKGEIKEWVQIIGQLSPLLAVIIAYLLKKKR